MQRIMNLVRKYDNHEPVVLGRVNVHNDLEIQQIKDFWEEFKESEPDCDTGFIEFLRSKCFLVDNKVVSNDIVLE